MLSTQFLEANDKKPSGKGYVPLSKDVLYKAQKQFPGYDDQQALLMYLASQTDDQEKLDNAQSNQITFQKKQIDSQRSENEKLKSALVNLGRELEDHERQAAQTDAEVERLKQLSAKLKPAGEITQQIAKVAADDLQKLEAELSQLKTKPGMDNTKFSELANQVKQLRDSPSFDNKELEKIQAALSNLSGQNTVNDNMFDTVMGELEKTKQSLDSKEERFKKYIAKKGAESEQAAKTSAEEMKKYSDIVTAYKNKIETDTANANKELATLRGEIVAKYKELEDKVTADFVDLYNRVAAKAGQAKPETTSEPVKTAKVGDEQPGLFGTDDSKVSPEAEKEYKDWLRRAGGSVASYAQELGQQAELDREMTKKGYEYLGKSKVAEAKNSYAFIQPAFDYSDRPMVKQWVVEYLPTILKGFKNYYSNDLKRKSPTYGDKQIAYLLEVYIDFLLDYAEDHDGVIPQEIYKKYYTAVKEKLFKQPVDWEQQDIEFKEGLAKAYEKILDRLVETVMYSK